MFSSTGKKNGESETHKINAENRLQLEQEGTVVKQKVVFRM